MNANEDLRRYAAASGVRLWQLAEAVGVSESHFSRRLRHELSAHEKSQLFAAVDEISKGVGHDDR